MRRALLGVALGVATAVAACGGDGDDGGDSSDGDSSDDGPDGSVDPADAGAASADADLSPAKPADLVSWLVGNDADAPVVPAGPGLVVMGGGADVDAAFTWWASRVAGGDVVVLRASGADGYNDYLAGFGADSVETLLVDARALAESDYVAWRVAHAEGVFIAGGDQSDYVLGWKGTPLEAALHTAWARGAVLGGTSAGAAILGEVAYAALAGSITSGAALDDPFDADMTLEQDFLVFAPLAGVVTDTHFGARDRMGRLVAFMARARVAGWAARPVGLGVDEGTALVVDQSGLGTVVGDGHVYLVVAPAAAPAVCTPGQPLAWSGLTLHALAAGDTVSLPAATTSVPGTPLAASGGALDPAAPYAD